VPAEQVSRCRFARTRQSVDEDAICCDHGMSRKRPGRRLWQLRRSMRGVYISQALRDSKGRLERAYK
jgi:hypothetical protein